MYAFLANLGIAISKLLAAIYTNSGSMLAVKIRMKSGINIDQAVAGINALERRIKEQFPEVGWCFIEPDNKK